MEKVKVTRVSWKDGEGASGAWHKIGILTEQLGEKWFGAFESKYNSKALRAITEGSEIEIVITQNGDFFNFSLAGKMDYMRRDIDLLMKKVFPPEPSTLPNSETSYPDGPEPEDIPF